MTIKDNGGREKLMEGRNFGMGFGFLRKLDDATYETATPVSACKDYLNDQVYSEATGKSVKVYGLTSTKQDLFKDGVYLTFKILNFNKAGEYPTQKQDTIRLTKTYPKMQTLINYVEDQLKVEEKTTISEANDGFYFVTVPKYWVQYPYLISLYTLVLRLGQFYENEETPEQFLETYSNQLDYSLWRQCIPNYKKLLINGLVKLDLNSYDPATSPYTIHNGGIRALQFTNE